MNERNRKSLGFVWGMFHHFCLFTQNSELCSCRGDSPLTDGCAGEASAVVPADSIDAQGAVDVEPVVVVTVGGDVQGLEQRGDTS